ncbi:MAG: hypothetical protein KGL53_10070, partial [Elusimicrobia bacterium]|nr:hypothetical protein [Elusimicrobiota bacterium]
PYGVADTLRLMSPALRDGIYDGVVLDRTSGLPALKEVVTVHADRANAPEFLSDAAERDGADVTPRFAAKLRYYKQAVTVQLPALTRLDVRLRRVVPDRKAASFEVVFDRYDAAEDVWTRYTLQLEQTDPGWGGGAVLERSGDYTRQTSAFRTMMERYAQDDSEIAFLLLGKHEGLRVEEVVRGRVGPLWSPFCPPPPGWFPPDPAGCYVLHCPLDRAALGMEADQDQDPFSKLFREFLSEDSRPVVEEAAARLGYRVSKERKFACTPQAAALLEKRLAEAGTRNVIYTI